jgi:FkbM family methyltransferase
LSIIEKVLIKIDVQGFEFDVMKGVEKTLRNDCAIISEF